MTNFLMLGQFYFSQLMGKPIYDANGKKIGKLCDMAVEWDSVAPQVVGIQYNSKQQRLIPVECLERIEQKQLKLKRAFDVNNTIELLPENIYIGKWLLDKQIIDLKGSKLVRVNDISLTWTRLDGQERMVLVAVDIGLRGVLRRIGLEFLLNRMNNRFLGWQYIKPLEEKTSSLQLNKEKTQLEQLHPADIADIIEQMDYHRRVSFINDLSAEQAVDALTEMDLPAQVEVISQMDEGQAANILQEMPPDEAANILGELPPTKSRNLLDLMERDEAAEVKELMDYDENTAGSLMTTEYISFSQDITAEQVILELRRIAPEAETIYYLYVLDEQGYMQGVLSLRELIIASPDSVLRDLMHTKMITINDFDSTRKAAEVIAKYGLLAVPVTNRNGVMVGIITVDDILEMIMLDRTKSDRFSWLIFSKRIARGYGL